MSYGRADSGSLDLIKSLMADEEVDFLFLIGVYRDDKVEAGRNLLTSDSERMELAELNLSAGKRAKTAAVFTTALRYFNTR